jgi:PAS domain S-box-containing protein
MNPAELFAGTPTDAHKHKSLHNAIVTINERGIIQSVDRKTCQLFGYEPDELHGKQISILIPPPYREQHDTYLTNYLKSGVKKIIDKRRLVEGLHKDGSIFAIMLSVTEVKVWNIRMYIGAIEKVPDKSVIINTDERGIITSCNKNVEEMLGYTVPELIGNSVNMLMPAAHAQKHDSYIQENFHSGGKWKMLGQVRNLPIKHKSGVVFAVCIQVTKVTTGGVTTFRGSIEHPPKETVFTIDQHGTIISCNYNFTLPMFGYSHQSLIHKNISMLIPELLLGEQDDTTGKKRKQASPTMITELVDAGARRVEVLHRDGSTFIVNLEVLRLKPEGGDGLEIPPQDGGMQLYSLQIKRVAENNNNNNGQNGNDANPSAPMEMIGEYCLGKTLGRGNYGVVRLAVHRQTGHKVAIKIIPKAHLDRLSMQRVQREIEILKQLNHPNVCHLIDVTEQPEALFLIIEYCEGGDLLAYMHRGAGGRINATVHAGELQEVILGPPLHEDDARRIFCQLASAVQHCHSKNVVHRDIKHKNILLDADGNIKLIDFGLSNWSCPGAMSFCGTPAYAAPEMLLGVQYMGPEVDVWSLGVVLYSLLTGKLPYLNVVDMVVGQLSIPDVLSSTCVDLIRRILVVEVSKRATVADIMAHPWVQQHVLTASSSSFNLALSTNTLNAIPVLDVAPLSPLSPLPSSLSSFSSLSEVLNTNANSSTSTSSTTTTSSETDSTNAPTSG